NNNVTDSCVTVTPLTPGLIKSFSPTTIALGGTTVLTFTISNPPTGNPAQTFSFTDTLPAGLQVAGTPGVVSSCTGGTITATAGSKTITVSGAQVGQSTGSATICTISVNVTNAPGQAGTCPNATFTNTAGSMSGLTNLNNNVTDSCVNVTA